MRRNWWLAFVVGIAVLNALRVAAWRWAVEAGNRTVELVAPYDTIASLAWRAAVPVDDLLGSLRIAGLTSVALSEPTVGDMVSSGQLQLYAPELARRLFPGARDSTSPFDFYLACHDSRRLNHVYDALQVRVPRSVGIVDAGDGGSVLGILGDQELLSTVGVGFDPECIGRVRRAGLSPVGRWRDYPAATPVAIREMISRGAAMGIHLAIFDEEEILGRNDDLPVVAESLRRSGVRFGFVEFAKQKGDRQLAALSRGNLVRVHSIPDKELNAMSESEAVLRFARAVKERNIRVCYINAFPQQREQPAQRYTALIQNLATHLRAAGFAIGQAQTHQLEQPTARSLALSAVGVAAGVAWLAEAFLGAPLLLCILLFGVGAAGLAGAVMALGPVGLKLTALLAAVTFPALGMMHCGLDAGANERLRRRGALATLAPLATLVRASACTLAGAALIVSLLADDTFLLKVDQFTGVKLAHLLPVLVTGLAYTLGCLPGREPLRARWQSVRERARELAAQPVAWGQAVLIVMVLGALALMVMRSSNEPGVGVSGTELAVREWLEQTLVARPRFKEFLLGHPALVFAAALLAAGRPRWAPFWVVVGAIGQVSLLNTFCHLHTPLAQSVIRSLNGLWLGAGLGYVAFGLFAAPGGSAGEPATPRDRPGPSSGRRERLQAAARKGAQRKMPRVP